MGAAKRAAKKLLREIEHFSRLVIGMELYPYQIRPLQHIIDSILNQDGREFLLVFPRQSGKNEAVAHLLVYLLNIFQRAGGNIVYGAIGDGVARGIRRLEQRLQNQWNDGRWQKIAEPTGRQLGAATVIFLSSHPQAFSRGETAHRLLVIDELQDQRLSHLEAVFQPMRAAYNATALYIGTVRFTHDALWRKKQELERLEQRDGRQRVFMVTPDEVTAANPHYRKFLAAQEEKLGKEHPIIQSEYYLQPIDAEGGLFGRRRMMLMKGQHGREQEPQRGRLYVATVDVAGADEGATDPIAQLDNPGRDYTVATVFEVQVGEAGGRNRYLAVDVFTDHGGRHFGRDGEPGVAARLAAWLEHWQVSHVVVDDARAIPCYNNCVTVKLERRPGLENRMNRTMQNWTPPDHWQRITTIDAHTAGEPLRIITGGLPDIPGDTILAKRRYAQTHLDGLRRTLMWEPRGHADMYGCILTPPVTADGDVGVLFLHNEGFSTMCGHGIIGLVKVGIETGALPAAGPEAGDHATVKIDTPAGRVVATAHMDGRCVQTVSFVNVPSFLLERDLEVDAPGLGRVVCDVAFGGAFYAYVDAEALGLTIAPDHAQALIDAGRRIKRAVMDGYELRHPAGEDDLNFLYGAIFVGPPATEGAHNRNAVAHSRNGVTASRNVCIFAEGEVDRCPTGTGVSGRLAIHHARGELGVGEPIVVESILGTRFTGRILDTAHVGDLPAVVPEITGTAHITGRHEFLIDPDDPLADGFIIR